MSDDRAWRDWLRVEDCVQFGVRRWMWFVIAAFAIEKYVEPSPLARILDMLAFATQVWWIRYDDGRRVKRTNAQTSPQ